jgi:quinol monooxygenase YgiN
VLTGATALRSRCACALPDELTVRTVPLCRLHCAQPLPSLRMSASSASASAAGGAAPFTQMISLSPKDAAAAARLVQLLQPVTAFVAEKEKGSTTLTYEMYTAASVPAEQERPHEVFAFETYASKRHHDDVHFPSPPVADFIAAVPALVAAPLGLRFLHPREGFHSRGEARETEVRASGVKPHLLVVTMDFASPAAAARFLEFARPLAAGVLAHEPACLTFHLYLASTEREADAAASAQVVIVERYLAVSDWWEVHRGMPHFKDFQAALAAADARAAHTTRRHYTELGMGFFGQA